MRWTDACFRCLVVALCSGLQAYLWSTLRRGGASGDGAAEQETERGNPHGAHLVLWVGGILSVGTPTPPELKNENAPSTRSGHVTG